MILSFSYVSPLKSDKKLKPNTINNVVWPVLLYVDWLVGCITYVGTNFFFFKALSHIPVLHATGLAR
jgi:hypothetical protein